jgi:hypothetical protein
MRSSASRKVSLATIPRPSELNVVVRTKRETSMPKHGSPVTSTARCQSSVDWARGMRASSTANDDPSIPASRASAMPSTPRASSALTTVAVHAARTVGPGGLAVPVSRSAVVMTSVMYPAS